MSLALRSISVLLKICLLTLSILYFSEIKEFIFTFVSLASQGQLWPKIHSKTIIIGKLINRTFFPIHDKYDELKMTLQSLELKRNFASESSGAHVVLKSKGLKHPKALIGNNKYNTGMLFDCHLSSEQNPIFVVIDLIEDVYIEEVLLISKSVYTNAIKDFRIHCSLDLAGDNWIEVGRFRNNKNRLYGRFYMNNSVLTRYVKLEITSTYDDHSEFYCSVSEMRVFGKTITSFTQKRNEQLLKINRELDVQKDILVDEDIQKQSWLGEKLRVQIGDNVTGISKNKGDLISNYIETCPVKCYREFLGLQSIGVRNEKIVDPYFELYDYLFSNIKALKLNVNTLIKSVLKEKKGVTESDPLRSYLQSFIKDRTQIIKRIKTIENSVVIMQEKSRRLNGIMFLELKTQKLENRIKTVTENSESSKLESQQKIKELSLKLEQLGKDQSFFFTFFLILLFLMLLGFLVTYRLLKDKIQQEKRPSDTLAGKYRGSYFVREKTKEKENGIH